jgi:ferric-dicitrate binding protein FerR (iron transport regulator)
MKIDDLANSFVDDQLDAEGLHELTQLLEQDPEARRAFVRVVDQHQTLLSLLGGARARRKNRMPWIAAAAAAAILVAVGIFFLSRPHQLPEPPFHPMAHDTKPNLPPPAPKEPETPRVIAPKETPVPPEPPAPPLVPPKAPERSAPAVTPEKPVESPPGETPKPDPVPPSAPPAARTIVVVATLQSVEGKVARGRVPLQVGDSLFEGDTIEAPAGHATVAFPDGSRIELAGEMTLALSRKISLMHGALTAEFAKQPAGQPFVIATPHAEATVLGTKLRLSVAAETKLEVKEGRVKMTRLEDNRALDITAGHYAVAAKGAAFAAKKTTRGPMMAGAAIWGEDFQDPRAVEKDWRIARNGVGASTSGLLEFDLHPSGDAGDASFVTEPAFAAPIRITADIEFTNRLRGVLAALRLGSWKEGKDLVHVDLDEERYYLTVGGKVVTADAGRKNPRRERWSLELRGDGTVVFSVDGRELLRGKRELSNDDLHLTLLAKSRRETPAGSKLRFENLVVERIR